MNDVTYTLRREAIAARLKAIKPRRSQLGILGLPTKPKTKPRFAGIASAREPQS